MPPDGVLFGSGTIVDPIQIFLSGAGSMVDVPDLPAWLVALLGHEMRVICGECY